MPSAPGRSAATPKTFDSDYRLEDRYTRDSGRVYLTGVQALVRLPLLQRQRDRAAGLNTAGFISGYRGSPLGTYDLALWQAQDLLQAQNVRFEPGLNEDLAATAVWGSQQANLLDGARYDGVFSIWYGKGPGVDRSCDALKHANYAGTAKHGGVLALAGDDAAARSSSIAHQSEQALLHCGIPILNPANVQEYVDFGLYGWALSRYSGCWIGFKCLTDTVDSAASVTIDPTRVQIRMPGDFEMPTAGLNLAWANYPLQVETRLFQQRLPAVQAFVRANGLDRVIWPGQTRRLGIVTTGKAYLDLRQALEELGIDERVANDLGISIYKVALSWPLEPEGAIAFARGHEKLLVVEEKRALIEDQFAKLLYNQADRPLLLGKVDLDGRPLIPSEGELAPSDVIEAVLRWLDQHAPEFAARARQEQRKVEAITASGIQRLPAFCSGCPHNSSTIVPENSIAMGGIGCHGMAVWLPERRTLATSQMGGEGATWIGLSPFNETEHIFQNLGDGTYFHSGYLAIRAAVAAGVNITYKILANGAVAMTGGQPIEGARMEGEITVPQIARQLSAEGVQRIAIVSNEPGKYDSSMRSVSGLTIHHREEIDRVQKELRGIKGVTAFVYDQTCAAEARRLRKRGEFPDPDQRVVINELVCEGCGDCSVQSNCISIEPIETELGRKRRINQSSCNKDFSCVNGYCPSFVTIEGGRLRKRAGTANDIPPLPEPEIADHAAPFNMMVTGIGGSGVITVGALVGMAAHLEGKGVSVLDVTGLAQKNGPVTSYVRVAAKPEDLHSTRIAAGQADLVLGSDIIVTSSADALSKMAPSRTMAVVNRHIAPTSDFATRPDLDLSPDAMEASIREATGTDSAHCIDATELATALLGDAIGTGLFLVGYATQLGRLPVSLAALERAIELNGRAIEMNKTALAWGRYAAVDLDAVRRAASFEERPGKNAESLDDMLAKRAAFLTEYQNDAYAQRYRNFVARVRSYEEKLGGGHTELTRAAARYYFKLLAYKDEYEVARLYTDGSFRDQIEREFEGEYKLRIHLAPQILNPRDPDTGRAKKRTLGAWVFGAFNILKRFKFLRGTPFDPFGWTAHRRTERALIAQYETSLEQVLDLLQAENHAIAVSIAEIPEIIRGFDLVKDHQIEAAKNKEAELLKTFQLSTRTE